MASDYKEVREFNRDDVIPQKYKDVLEQKDEQDVGTGKPRPSKRKRSVV